MDITINLQPGNRLIICPAGFEASVDIYYPIGQDPTATVITGPFDPGETFNLAGVDVGAGEVLDIEKPIEAETSFHKESLQK